MLKPLFDKNSELIGWIEPGKHIFNHNMDWIAYISRGHAWSSKTGNWIGPVNDLVCLDTNGKVIAWSKGANIRGSVHPANPARATRAARPARPARPAMPARPAKPATPVGGWSNLSINEWLNQ